nr:MAG TPA: hypothetical protein [Caudoviricetes sp.]
MKGKSVLFTLAFTFLDKKSAVFMPRLSLSI